MQWFVTASMSLLSISLFPKIVTHLSTLIFAIFVDKRIVSLWLLGLTQMLDTSVGVIPYSQMETTWYSSFLLNRAADLHYHTRNRFLLHEASTAFCPPRLQRIELM